MLLLSRPRQRWVAPTTFTTSSRVERCNGPSAGTRNDPSPLEPVSCVVTLGSAAFGLMPGMSLLAARVGAILGRS